MDFQACRVGTPNSYSVQELTVLKNTCVFDLLLLLELSKRIDHVFLTCVPLIIPNIMLAIMYTLNE